MSDSRFSYQPTLPSGQPTSSQIEVANPGPLFLLAAVAIIAIEIVAWVSADVIGLFTFELVYFDRWHYDGFLTFWFGSARIILGISLIIAICRTANFMQERTGESLILAPLAMGLSGIPMIVSGIFVLTHHPAFIDILIAPNTSMWNLQYSMLDYIGILDYIGFALIGVALLGIALPLRLMMVQSEAATAGFLAMLLGIFGGPLLITMWFVAPIVGHINIIGNITYYGILAAGLIAWLILVGLMFSYSHGASSSTQAQGQ